MFAQFAGTHHRSMDTFGYIHSYLVEQVMDVLGLCRQ